MSQYETLEAMKKGVYYSSNEMCALTGESRMVINKDFKKLHKWKLVEKKKTICKERPHYITVKFRRID